MVYEIVFKKRFQNKLEQVFIYIETEFGLDVSQKFASRLDKKFKLLQQQPFIGRRSISFNNIRSISAGKQNRIYYKIEANKVVVLNMFDTRINPSKNKYQ